MFTRFSLLWCTRPFYLPARLVKTIDVTVHWDAIVVVKCRIVGNSIGGSSDLNTHELQNLQMQNAKENRQQKLITEMNWCSRSMQSLVKQVNALQYNG